MITNLRHKLVKTRKTHKCFGCTYTFPKGCHLFCDTIVDGHIFNTYLCWPCEEASSKDNEEFGEGDLYEDTFEVILDKCVNTTATCEDAELDKIYTKIVERCGPNLGTSFEHVIIVDELRECPEAGKIFIDTGLMLVDENHKELRLHPGILPDIHHLSNFSVHNILA